MKRIITIAAAFVLGMAALAAQPGQGRGKCDGTGRRAGLRCDKTLSAEDRALKRVDCMKERLSLTDGQADKMEALYTDYFNKQEKERTRHMEARKKNMEDRESSMARILTPEQMEKWRTDCRMDGERGKGRGPGQDRRPGKPGKRPSGQK